MTATLPHPVAVPAPVPTGIHVTPQHGEVMSVTLTSVAPVTTDTSAGRGEYFARWNLVDTIAEHAQPRQVPTHAQIRQRLDDIRRRGESRAAWDVYVLAGRLEAVKEWPCGKGCSDSPL